MDLLYGVLECPDLVVESVVGFHEVTDGLLHLLIDDFDLMRSFVEPSEAVSQLFLVGCELDDLLLAVAIESLTEFPDFIIVPAQDADVCADDVCCACGHAGNVRCVHGTENVLYLTCLNSFPLSEGTAL